MTRNARVPAATATRWDNVSWVSYLAAVPVRPCLDCYCSSFYMDPMHGFDAHTHVLRERRFVMDTDSGRDVVLDTCSGMRLRRVEGLSNLTLKEASTV